MSCGLNVKPAQEPPSDASASARFAGTIRCRRTRFVRHALPCAPENAVAPMLGQVEYERICCGSIPGKSRDDSKTRLFDSISAIFSPAAAHECDSKANRYDKSGVAPQLVVNFSLTNQRADSFSPPGVNLEAKV
jgi:hypothetical protein